MLLFLIHEYIELVKVHFARQVGSQYHVTSYNAGQILCFAEAIKQTYIPAQLKLDRLLFDHIL